VDHDHLGTLAMGKSTKQAMNVVKATRKEPIGKTTESDAQPLWYELSEKQSVGNGGKKQKLGLTSDLAIATWKAMRVNIKIAGYNPEQLRSLTNNHGEQLFPKVLKDRERVAAGDPDAPVFGKIYYDQLKKDFAPGMSPAKKLKITDPDETLDEEVSVALEDVHSYPKSKIYDRINTLLLETPDLNQRTFVLNEHQALKTLLATDIASCKFLLSLLKWIKENNAHTSYPEAWSVIKPWMDLALKESYEHARAAKKPVLRRSPCLEELEKMCDSAVDADLEGHAGKLGSPSKAKAKAKSKTAREAVLKMLG